MSADSFDPDSFFNCDEERASFEDLLTFSSDARILAISDQTGAGKSRLLKMFRHRCLTGAPRVPVSLVDLARLPEHTPLGFASHIVADLTNHYANHMTFRRFQHLHAARLSADFGSIAGAANFENALFVKTSDVRMAGVMANFDKAENVFLLPTRPALTPEQDDEARRRCLDALVDDLQASCLDSGAVILVDSFEKCSDELVGWLVNRFLERLYLSATPPQVLVVLAGHSVPRFEEVWPSEVCDRVVRKVDRIADWRPEHLEQCARAYGCTEFQEIVEALSKLVKRGFRAQHIVQSIELIVETRRS